MSQALIQSNASVSAGTGTTATLTFTSNVALNDLLAVAVAWTGTASCTLADSLTNTWTQIGLISTLVSGVTLNLAVYWALANAAGSTTITATFGSSQTGIWIGMAEFTGINGPGVPGNEAASYVGYGTNASGTNPYASQTGSLLAATQAPFSTATGALILVAATTAAQTATYSLNPIGEANYAIAVQAGGICLMYQLNAYADAPNGHRGAPLPSVLRAGDTSNQWLLMTVPFATSQEPGPLALSAPLSGYTSPLSQIFQYPAPVFQTPSKPNVVD